MRSYSYDLAEMAIATLCWHDQIWSPELVAGTSDHVVQRSVARDQSPTIQPQRCVFVGDVLNVDETPKKLLGNTEDRLKVWLNRLSLQVYGIVAASQAGYEVATGLSEAVVLHAPMVTCAYSHANKAAKKSFIQPYMEPFRLEVRRWKLVEHIDSDVQYVAEVVVSRDDLAKRKEGADA